MKKRFELIYRILFISGIDIMSMSFPGIKSIH